MDLILDGDDTIWYEEKYFKELKNQLLHLAKINNIDVTEVEELLENTIKMNGFGRGVFVEALQLTAKYFDLSGELKTLADKKIEKLINFEMKFVHGFYDASILLKRIAKNIFLYTKGRTEEQLRKVRKIGIEHYFNKIYIVPQKDVFTLENILLENNSDKRDSIIIGNSPKDDINPGISLGLTTFYFNPNWNPRCKEVMNGPGFLEFSDWKGIVRYLETQLKQ